MTVLSRALCVLLILIAAVACTSAPPSTTAPPVSPTKAGATESPSDRPPSVTGAPVASPSAEPPSQAPVSMPASPSEAPPSQAAATPTDAPSTPSEPATTPTDGPATPEPTAPPVESPTATPVAPTDARPTETAGGATSVPSPSEPTPSGAAPSPSAGGSGGPGTGGLTADLTSRLQKVLDKTVTRAGLAGMQAAVLLDDGSAWSGESGDRVLKTDTPIDRDTVFSIASITKTFVTAVVMQLVAEGKLSLSDPLSTWVPTVQNAKTITVGDLLGHTSGVYNYFENPRYNPRVFSNPKHRWTFDEIMALVRAPYCKPATCYHYSNTNFVLLGRIVELVTGNSLADEIASRLSTPLSLGNTGLQPDDPTPADRAHGYLGTTDWTRKSSLLPTVSAATVAGAAGAMTSTASDLATWARALYDGEVVPDAQLKEMLSFKKCQDNYGLGTRKLIINGRVAYGHLGSLRGYTNAMLFFPREGATVVILSNEGSWGIDGAMRKLTNALWEGIGAPAPQFDASLNTTIHDGVTLHCRQGTPP